MHMLESAAWVCKQGVILQQIFSNDCQHPCWDCLLHKAVPELFAPSKAVLCPATALERNDAMASMPPTRTGALCGARLAKL